MASLTARLCACVTQEASGHGCVPMAIYSNRPLRLGCEPRFADPGFISSFFLFMSFILYHEVTDHLALTMQQSRGYGPNAVSKDCSGDLRIS